MHRPAHIDRQRALAEYYPDILALGWHLGCGQCQRYECWTLCVLQYLLLGQSVAATAFMATFVTAFALLTDALRDALDPKLN